MKKEKGLRNRSDRCDYCEMKRKYCICDEIPDLELKTRVLIIMHVSEIILPSNTARLIAKSLKNCEIKIRGEKGIPLCTKNILLPKTKPLFLYPGPTAVELNEDFLSQIDKPINLIIPDGSWRQARKVRYRTPILTDVQEVKLPPGPPSQYFLRKARHPHQLSTFEAIARSLGIIEGKWVQKKLEDLFHTMVKRTLRSRGIHNFLGDAF